MGSGFHAVNITLEGKLPRIISGTVNEGGLAAWIDLTEASLRRKTGTIIMHIWRRAQLEGWSIKRAQTPTFGQAEGQRS